MDINYFYKNIGYLKNQNLHLEKHISKQIDTVLNLKDCKLSDAIEISVALNVPLQLLSEVDIEKKQLAASSAIKMLVLDVDGVMTDGKIIYTEQGDELKQFYSKDGLAIRAINKKGIKVGFLSHGITGNILKKRADILYADYVYVGNEEKPKVLNEWLKKEGINLKNVAYIGDDLNDLEVIKSVGFSACPADAVNQIKNNVHVILNAKGGEGAVRELIDNYLL